MDIETYRNVGIKGHRDIGDRAIRTVVHRDIEAYCFDRIFDNNH